MALSSLGQRVTTAVILVPLVLAALFLLPPLGWAVVTLVVVLLAAHEWAKLVGYVEGRWLLFVGGALVLGLALLFVPAFRFGRGWPDGVVYACCGAAALFWLAVAPRWLARGWATPPLWRMAAIGWVVLIGAWVALVELQARSPWLVLAAMACIWIADTAAYFSGRRFGRRKLAPAISPGKTWEGVWGALVAVAAYALLLIPFADDARYSGSRSALALAAYVAFALLLAAVSVIGDLYESLLKRHAGVKDSGTLLPGHGGALDRIDALLAAMPFAALAATAFLARDGA
jgi:phosphatidate cytidylyltransferase